MGGVALRFCLALGRVLMVVYVAQAAALDAFAWFCGLF